MKKLVVILGLLLFASLFGGCAVIPAIVTTGASFAVPQSASLAITTAGTVHKTALIAADERQLDEMISDKMITIQAQAVLLAETGTDMDATCLNGDLYVVGEYATPADRESAIAELEKIKGVKSVKGVIKQMPSSLVALIEPAIADSHAETVIEAGLFKALHIKSANVDVEVVQGEAVIMGVVRDVAEAESVVRIVEDLRPDTRKPIKVTSLLVFQDAYEAGLPQLNDAFALRPQSTMVAAVESVVPTVGPEVEEAVAVTVVETRPAVVQEKPSLSSLATYVPKDLTPWQKSRRKMKRRILSLAKVETDPQAKRELISLSSKVCKDTMISIEDRLARALRMTTNLSVKGHVNAILSDIAPNRMLPIQTIAMN